MPDLKELLEQRAKKQFKKKSYRPWDLTGRDTLPSTTEKSSTVVTLPTTTARIIEPTQSILETKPLITSNPIVHETPAPATNAKYDNNQVSKSGINQVAESDNNRYQLDNNQVPESGTNRYQLGNNWVSELDINLIKNTSDLGQLLDPTSIKNKLAKLTGVQKRIMDTVIDTCVSNKKLETGPLLTSGLANYVSTTVGTTKTSLNRLIERGFLKRGVGRTAPGGYIHLHIDQQIFDLFLQLRKEKKSGIHPILSKQIKNIGVTQDSNDGWVSESDINSPYSSSININNTTTNNAASKNFELSEAWTSVDYSPLEEIGFTKTQLKQLVEKNSPEVVQESIHFFAYDIKQNPNKYTSPLNVLMGVLRKGNAWSAPKGYESPKDQALREYTERKKAALEKRNKLLNDLMDAEFSDWESRLSEQEVESIVPEQVRNLRIDAAKTSTLKIHFRENVLIPRLKGEGVY